MIDMRGLVTIGAMIVAIYAVFGQPMGAQRERQVSVRPIMMLMVSSAPDGFVRAKGDQRARALLQPAAYVPSDNSQGGMRRQVP